MNSLDNFKQSIKSKIKEIDMEYKSIYKDYEPTENEKKLISFLDDIWGIRFKDEILADNFKKASVQCFFIDKNNSNNYFDKSFPLAKLHPKQSKTTPLYYLIFRLAESKDYHFFLCPNIFSKTKQHYQNWEKNISASNSYYIDIDEIHMDKPIYNCSEEEILQYLYAEYPILKKTPPSYIVMSGSGLHLYFTLEYTEYLFGDYYHNPNRSMHKDLTSDLITLLTADKACKNLNRLLRVPFSFNLKYPVKTRFYAYDSHRKSYSCEILRENVAAFLPPAQDSVLARKEKIATLENTLLEKQVQKNKTTERNYNTTPEQRSLIASKARAKLFSDRRNDLEKWFYLHLKDMEGYRHNFFLIYSIILKQQHNKADYIENQCKRLNAKLLLPLTESELLKIICQEHHYTFQNQTISEWLNFTQAEISTMSCHYGADAVAEYHRERSIYYNELRKEEVRQKREFKQTQIFKVIAENPDATIVQLAELLGCSKATVSRWKKKFRELNTE